MSTKAPHSAFVDLLDRLLDRGVYLKADLIVSVAGVPLLGASLQAVVGGMETLLAYGVFRDWDAAIRSEPKAPQQYLLQSPAALWGKAATGGQWVRGTLTIAHQALRLTDTAGTLRLDVPYSDLKGALLHHARSGPGASAAFLRLSLAGEDVWLHVHHLKSLVSVLSAQGIAVFAPEESGSP